MTLAPQTTRLEADVLRCDDEGDRFDCTLRVRRVHAYGPSSKPLPPGTDLDVRLRKRVLPDTLDGPAPGQRVEVTLRREQGVATAETSAEVWHVLRIH